MAALFLLLLISLVQKSDDGLGALVAGSTDGVPRKPVHGRHGAADAAVHASATAAAAAASPCSPSSSSSSSLCFWCSAMVLTASWSPWP